MAGLESQNSFETNNPVVNTGVSESEDFNNSLTEVAKTKVKILQLLDSADVPEENQDDLLNKVLKYQDNKDIFDTLLEKIENSFDEEDVKKYLQEAEASNEKAEVSNEKAEVSNENKDKLKEGNISQQRIDKYNENKDKIDEIIKVSKLTGGLNNPKYSQFIEYIKQINIDNFEIDDSEIFDKAMAELQKPDVIPSIADDLGGPTSEKYEAFKSSLVAIDPSFTQYFTDYENVRTGKSVEVGDIVSSVEKDSAGVIDIDLKDVPPLSKLSVVGSNYSFDTQIDVNELDNINSEHKEKLSNLQSSISHLKSLGVFFNTLVSNIGNSTGREQLVSYVDSFVSRSSANLQEMTSSLGGEVVTLTTSDFLDLKNVTNPEDLKFKIGNIRDKMNKIRDYVVKESSGIYKQYEKQIKDLLQQKQEKKKEQLKTLHFLHSIGFDRVPQSITDTIITQINLNKGAFGLDTDIDLRNGVLGFSDGIDGNSPKEKEKFIRLFNKMISGAPELPVPLAIATGTMAAIQPEQLKHILESDLVKVGGVGKAMENLRTEKTSGDKGFLKDGYGNVVKDRWGNPVKSGEF